MDPRHLFSDLPENLGDLLDDKLEELKAEHLAAIDKITAALSKDATAEALEFVAPCETKEAAYAELESGVEDVLRINEVLAARQAVDGDLAAKAAEKLALVRPELAAETAELSEESDDSGDDDAGDGDDADAGLMANRAVHTFVDSGDGTCMECGANKADDAHDANDQLTAAAEEKPVTRRPLPKPSSQHRAVQAEEPAGFVASAGVPGYAPGQRLDTKLDLAKAMVAAAGAVQSMPPGFRQDVVVASVDTRSQYPEERRLRLAGIDPDGWGNDELIKLATTPGGRKPGGISMVAGGGMTAMVAAGGVCAPVTPYYGQQFIAVLDRPVRDAMVSYNADRGGVRYNPPIGISTISGSDAIGIVTEEEDSEGGTFAAKTCQTVVCVDAVEVDVDIIYHCVIWSNLTARTFPERVAQYSDTVMAGFARLAETNLLNAIKAGSTNVTQANTNTQGAVSSLLGSVLTAAAGQRSRQRMAPDATLRAIFPAWGRDLLVADIVRSQFQRFDMSEQGLIALLRSYNIEPSFTIDGPSTGTGQVFGAQTAGALEPFPTSMQWALYPEGTWMFLDGGVLELGIVRDSVLNAENQFEIFGESFENAANVGIESLWITTDVCPSGTVAAPKDNSSFCG